MSRLLRLTLLTTLLLLPWAHHPHAARAQDPLPTPPSPTPTMPTDAQVPTLGSPPASSLSSQPARPATGPASLLGDIFPLPYQVPNIPIESVQAGNLVYFVTRNSYNRSDSLWRTDGTAEGTILLKEDLGMAESDRPHRLTVVNNLVFFFVSREGYGVENEPQVWLWRTDGTPAGTIQVQEAESATHRANGTLLAPPTVAPVGNQLFFLNRDSNQLWRTDGTVAGTHLVKTFPLEESPFINWLTVGGDTLYFFTNDTQLWKSNGTEAGTIPVGTIEGPSMVTATSNLLYVIQWNGGLWRSDGTPDGTFLLHTFANQDVLSFATITETLFFGVFNGAALELWRSTGTISDTVPLSLGSALPSVFRDQPETWPTTRGNTLYFRASESTGGVELWRSHGTSDTAQQVKDINPGLGSSNPRWLRAVGPHLFFVADNGTGASHLWRTDGTESDTLLMKETPVDGPGLVYYPLAPLGDLHLFAALGPDGALALWRSDGTPQGTLIIHPLIRPTTDDSYPSFFPGREGEALFHVWNAGSVINSLWQSDGTPTGTRSITIIPKMHAVGVGDKLLWVGEDTDHGEEIWVGDGTPEGSALLFDANPGPASANPLFLHHNQDQLIFATTTVESHCQLWQTDGTLAGTTATVSIEQGCGQYPDALKSIGEINGILYLTRGTELWRTDGTSDGTRALHYSLRAPNLVVERNGLLLFTAQNDTSVQKLWRSDGTMQGTTLVKDITLGFSETPFSQPIAMGDYIYFIAQDTHIPGLWKSDGTSEGTTRVIERAGPISILGTVANQLFLQVDDTVHGGELWVSDGTTQGTHLLLDIASGARSSLINPLAQTDTLLLFTAKDEQHGCELWRVDASGARLVKDIAPGFASAFSRWGSSYEPDCIAPDPAVLPDGRVLFWAFTSATGTELWITDGTPTGTQLVQDLVPGARGSFSWDLISRYPTREGHMLIAGPHLFFGADDGTHGIEPWVLDWTTLPRICYDFASPLGVGVEDVQLAARRWRQHTAHPDWDARIDTDHSGTIDIRDILGIASRWGCGS